MSDDEKFLRDLNVEIGKAESDGNRNRLAEILAPELAFYRADGKTIDDAGRFLQKVMKSEDRTTDVESVEVLGNRAIVRCTVKMGAKKFHNVRLFVRYEGIWKLLAWANEPMQPMS